MIVGIGVDICAISRMRQATSSARFVGRVFSPEEIGYAREGASPAERFASAFAAKEALAKALGVSVWRVLGDAGVRRENGVPSFSCRGALRETLASLGVRRAHLSLSHDAGVAAAFVILEA